MSYIRLCSFTTGFLLFRVLKTGSDTRFDDIRSHFFKFMGASMLRRFHELPN